MEFTPALKKARLLKRYKRFLADLETPDGHQFTAHCANTGRMTGCAEPGFSAYYSQSDNAKRKYPCSLELTQNTRGDLICVNTALANRVTQEAIEQGRIPELSGYKSLRSEVKYGSENSRIDLLLEDPDKPSCYIEVKSVTLLEGEEQGYFPDAKTERGQKHLRELIEMVKQGHRAVLFFAVLHSGIRTVTAAAHIDGAYAKLFNEALKSGVEVLAYRADISPTHMALQHAVPVTRAQC